MGAPDGTAVLSTAHENVIGEIVRRLVEHYRPLKVILFGSRAWGQPDDQSDVDLFLIKDTDERFLDRTRAATRVLYETGVVPCAVDLLVYTPKELAERLALGDPFVRRVVERGIPLYGPTDAGMA